MKVMARGKQRHHTSVSPEKKLLWALLDDAIACITGKGGYGGKVIPSSFGTRTYGGRGKLADDAARWMEAGDDGPFSFRYVCEHLGLDPDAVRKQRLKVDNIDR